MGVETIHDDVVIEDYKTGHLLTGIPSKLFLGVFYVSPHPAPGFVAEDLDAVLLHYLGNMSIGWIRFKFFELGYNAILANDHFVMSKAAAVGCRGKALRNIATKVAILNEQPFRFRLS